MKNHHWLIGIGLVVALVVAWLVYYYFTSKAAVAAFNNSNGNANLNTTTGQPKTPPVKPGVKTKPPTSPLPGGSKDITNVENAALGLPSNIVVNKNP